MAARVGFEPANLRTQCTEHLRGLWLVFILHTNLFFRKLAVYDKWSELVIHVAMDNSVVIEDICKNQLSWFLK